VRNTRNPFSQATYREEEYQRRMKKPVTMFKSEYLDLKKRVQRRIAVYKAEVRRTNAGIKDGYREGIVDTLTKVISDLQEVMEVEA